MTNLLPIGARAPALAIFTAAALSACQVPGTAARAHFAAPTAAAGVSESNSDASTYSSQKVIDPFSPFVYDALGATPSIRLPTLHSARKPAHASESIEAAAGGRPTDQGVPKPTNSTDTAAR
jgi:hypothetical protein